MAITNAEEVEEERAACTAKTAPLVSGRELVLGSLKIHISRAGVLANDCTQLAWWHNGELLGNHRNVSDMSANTVDDEVALRENHSMLELRPGDLVAFRFRESSYYCFKGLVDLVVNGTSMSTTSAGMKAYYTRIYAPDWYMPSFRLTPDRLGVDESESDTSKFIPFRTKRRSSNTTVLPGKDYWAPRDDSNLDNKRSNWYFRFEIPSVAPAI